MTPSIVAYALCGLGSYLLGAVPFAYLIAKAHGVDIRTVGSGNVGATNVFRSVGKAPGIATFACDMLKGLLPVALFPALAARAVPGLDMDPLKVTCTCLAVVGHSWPVFLGFKGGKGVATSTGALLGMAPLAMLAGLVAWVVVFLPWRYVSLSSIVAAVCVAGAGWPLYRSRGLLIPVFLIVLAALVVWRHRANIRRLMQGTEHSFRRKEKA